MFKAPELTDARGAAERLFVSERTLSNWRYQGRGPAYLKVGGKIVYRIAVLEAWLEARTTSPEVA
jgi:hypothetical protein